MTRKEYKKACRIKVERYSKLVTFLLVNVFLTIGYFGHLDGWLVGLLSSTIWFFAPDVVAYYLENKYKISHMFTYR